MTSETDFAGLSTIRAMSDFIDSVYDELQLRSGSITAAINDKEVSAREMKVIDEELKQVLVACGTKIDGVGVAFAAGALDGGELWLEWWQHGRSNKPEFVRHSVDQRSVRYYDYTAMVWFEAPTRRKLPTTTGPYIDSGGTDISIITLAVPLLTNHGVCVLAADVRLSQLESVFRAALPRDTPGLIVCNGHHRVIVSNDTSYPAGSLVPEQLWDGGMKTVLPSADTDRLPWYIFQAEKTT